MEMKPLQKQFVSVKNAVQREEAAEKAEEERIAALRAVSPSRTQRAGDYQRCVCALKLWCRASCVCVCVCVCVCMLSQTGELPPEGAEDEDFLPWPPWSESNKFIPFD